MIRVIDNDKLNINSRLPPNRKQHNSIVTELIRNKKLLLVPVLMYRYLLEIFAKSERDTYIVFLLGGRCVTVTARLNTVTASAAASTLPATQHTVITNTNTGFTASTVTWRLWSVTRAVRRTQTARGKWFATVLITRESSVIKRLTELQYF